MIIRIMYDTAVIPTTAARSIIVMLYKSKGNRYFHHLHTHTHTSGCDMGIREQHNGGVQIMWIKWCAPTYVV